MSSNAPRTYAALVWAEVRRRYLGGETAPALCAEFGVSRSTLIDRARKGKWRRKDFKALEDAQIPAPTDPRAAALEAIARAALAAASGDHAKAEAAARLAERLIKTANLLARQGMLDLPCPHCGALPSDTREDRAKRDETIWDEINRSLDGLRGHHGADPPDDDGDDDWEEDD